MKTANIVGAGKWKSQGMDKLLTFGSNSLPAYMSPCPNQSYRYSKNQSKAQTG